MAYVEIAWRYDQRGTDDDYAPIFLARSPLLSGLTNGYVAAELYAIGWRLVAVLPPWPGRVYGTSIWDKPDTSAQKPRGS